MCLSQASVDPAGTVPQPGLAGPSWDCALARPHRTQLVLCVSQASRDPEGSLPQLGHLDPAGLPQWHGCLIVAALDSVSHCGCTLKVFVVTVVVLLQAATVMPYSVLTVVAILQ